MPNELRQSFALFPRRSGVSNRISKPSEGSVKKFVCGRSVLRRCLVCRMTSQKRALLNDTFQQPFVGANDWLHMIDDTGPGNDRHDIYLRVCPGVIQKSDILLSTKQIASCNRQSG